MPTNVPTWEETTDVTPSWEETSPLSTKPIRTPEEQEQRRQAILSALPGLRPTSEQPWKALGDLAAGIEPLTPQGIQSQPTRIVNRLTGKNYAEPSADEPYVNFEGLLQTPLQMLEQGLRLPPNLLTGEATPITGMARSIENTLTGLTTFNSLFALPAFGVAPEARAGQQALKTLFAASMAKDLPAQTQESIEVGRSPTASWAQKGEAAANPLVTGTFASLLSRDVIGDLANAMKRNQISRGATEQPREVQTQPTDSPQSATRTFEQQLEDIAQKVADPKAGKLTSEENAILGKLAVENPGQHQTFLSRVAKLRQNQGRVAGLKPENVQVTVNKDAETGIGYVQVDEITPEGNPMSSNPEQLQKWGFAIPTSKELLTLPQGKYRLPEAQNLLKEGAQNATETRQEPQSHGLQYSQAGPRGVSTETGRGDSVQPSTKVGEKGQEVSTIGQGIQAALAKNVEAGSVGFPDAISEAIHTATAKFGDSIRNLGDVFSDENLRAQTMKLGAVSVPKTTAASKAVGNQLTMFAQAEGVAETVAKSLATDVLGEHYKDPVFDRNLGAVLVEDQLRGLQSRLEKSGKANEAAKVNTVVGQNWSPIKSEAQYQQLLKSKAVQDAIARHKETVQARARTAQEAVGGKLRGGGAETDAFVNLIPMLGEEGAREFIFGRRQGDLTATLKKGTRFGKEFKGTAPRYELSYRAMAERMVKGNWAEVEKRKLFDMAAKSGIAVLQKAGEARPELEGKWEQIPIQRRMMAIVKKGERPQMVSQNETLWVKDRYAEEFRQAFQTDSPLRKGLVRRLAHGVTSIQVSLGADAAFHTGNMLAAVNTAAREQTGANIAGLREADTARRIIRNAVKVWQDTPEVQRQLAQMAEEAGIVRQGEAHEASLLRKLVQPGGVAIRFIDKVGRLTLDELYQERVKAGMSPDDPVWRRAAVQGQLGEYNKRLLTKVQQLMKESGASPFLVAGRTFNRLGIRQLLLSPQTKAASPQAWARMRMQQALYVLTGIVVAPMVINTMTVGNPYGRTGVEIGQIDTGKDTSDGRHITVDMAQISMMRRGMRITGIQALASGIRDKQSPKQIGTQMVKDVATGLTHPYAGPAVQAAEMLRSGEDFSGFRRATDQSLTGRIKEAARTMNPTIETFAGRRSTETVPERTLTRFGRVVGARTTPSALQRINKLAREFNERQGKQPIEAQAGPYGNLTTALRKGDAEAVRSEIAKLRETHSDKQILLYYNNYPYRAFAGSAKDEETFKKGLSPEDKQLYDEVRRSNLTVQRNFYNIILHRPPPRERRQRAPRAERPAKALF